MFSHAASAFAEVAGGDSVTFVPYALADWDDYADRVTAALAVSVEARPVHRCVGRDQPRVPDDPHDQRHADLSPCRHRSHGSVHRFLVEEMPMSRRLG